MALQFEQQPNESAKAYGAFCEYLAMGPQRKLKDVAKKLGRTKSATEWLSRKHHWQARAQAYVAHLTQKEREAAEAAALEDARSWMAKKNAARERWLERQEVLREEEWKVRRELIELCRDLMQRWKTQLKFCGSLEGIARMLELASKLGRLASGLATDKTEITGDGGGPVRVEVTLALEKIYGMPLPGEVVDVEEIGKQKAESGNGSQNHFSLPLSPKGGEGKTQ